jgi:DNA-binding response OmpR family regulator
LTHVLIIEDDASMAALLVKHFEKKMSWKTNWQGSGEGALAWLKTAVDHDVDFVVCDLGLPGMGGAKVVEALRADARMTRVPIIVCSARTSMQDHTLALEAGADLFLEKPLRLKHFEAEVLRLLGERQ